MCCCRPRHLHTPDLYPHHTQRPHYPYDPYNSEWPKRPHISFWPLRPHYPHRPNRSQWPQRADHACRRLHIPHRCSASAACKLICMQALRLQALYFILRAQERTGIVLIADALGERVSRLDAIAAELRDAKVGPVIMLEVCGVQCSLKP